MTEKQRQNLLKRKAELAKDYHELDRAIIEIGLKGTASATISAAGGTKSYTRTNLTELRNLKRDVSDEYQAVVNALKGSGFIRKIRTIGFVRS